jgi:hypothetical protein
MTIDRRAALSSAAAALALCLLWAAGAQAANRHANFHAVCPTPSTAHGHCYALVVTDRRGNPRASSAPTGLAPQAIRSAYGFPAEGALGEGETIAIVDAYDDPSAESDLSTFSAQFGLPPCTSAGGCFKKVDQGGGSAYPRADQGWALEISLDVQWAHAIAPKARILLVEASSNSFANLLAAEDYAKAHAQYVSNSWGGSEFAGESAYDGHFVQPGTSFFVAAGDSGLPAEYPSASPNVISVGGTTLHFHGGEFSGETGWSGGGGGCSAYEPATSAQSGLAGYGQVGCAGRRATPDVALDADPSSGVAVYDSVKYYGQTGWFTVGGTSASAPMWAGRSAVAGVTVDASYVYGGSIGFRDILEGNNGAPCLIGFDLCSGRGSWASAGSPPQQEGSLSFAGAAQALSAGQPSAPMQVALSPAPGGDLAVSLSSSSGAGRFATSAGGPWSPSLELTVPGGETTSAPFYYEDTAAGTPTLSAGAAGYAGASQTETVSAAALDSIAVSPPSASVVEGGSQEFRAAGTDEYGNPVDVSGATWTTSAPGSLSATSGASTVFTAAATTGSGAVTATVGSIQGSAAVTVEKLTLLAPTDLTAVRQGRHIGLAWQGSGSGVTYNLYRGSSSGGEKLYASGLTETSAKDMGVSSGTTYYYYVTAVAPSGAESAASNEASATAR